MRFGILLMLLLCMVVDTDGVQADQPSAANPAAVQAPAMQPHPDVPWHLPRSSFATRVEWRATIKSMDMLDRPDRFGHFYGNAVRRQYRRTH